MIDQNSLHRGVKMAMDSGEAKTVDEAYALFGSYRIGVCVGAEVATSPAHQAAVLSLVNAGRRTFLGGVFVAGVLDVPLLLPSFFGGTTLKEATVAMGGRLDAAPADTPMLLVGKPTKAPPSPVVLRLSFNAWAGGVSPLYRAVVLREHAGDVLGALLSAGVALSEVFQALRNNGIAARRVSGLSAWNPSSDWTRTDGVPELSIAPNAVWVLGLGHLGQAFLWALALLTHGSAERPRVLLHDFDIIKRANDSTSLLIDLSMRGRKTRVLARQLESVGIDASLVERPFNGREAIADQDPRILFCGVDNGLSRALIDQAGFELVVEAGLGNGPIEYQAMRLHTFPATRSAASFWNTTDGGGGVGRQAPAYADLERKGLDDCGVLQIAERSVGVPFVGVVAAALALGEITRTLLGAHRHEVIDLSLRDPGKVAAVRLANNCIGNPGFLRLKGSER